MAIRLIVTGTDADGRSHVVSDGSAGSLPAFAELWLSEGGDPLRSAATEGGPQTASCSAVRGTPGATGADDP